MSAYCVAPEQIAEIVKWAVCSARKFPMNPYNLVTKEVMDVSPLSLCVILAQANVDSLKARYGDGAEGMYSETFPDDVIKEYKSGPTALYTDGAEGMYPNLGAADIFKMCRNLDYQACEVPNWVKTDAYWILSKIEGMAADNMAAKAKYPWGYSKNEEVA